MVMMKRYLTEEEQQKLLSTPKQLSDVIARRDYAWMRLLIATGFRITEFSLLTVADATTALKTGYIYIPKDHRKGKKRDHTKLVTQPIREALTDLLEIRREMGYHEIGNHPLVMSRNHGRMTVRSYQQRIRYWADRAGIPGNVSPHWCRHTRGMNIMRRSTSNDPRGIVQQELGHASISTTGIYTTISREDLAAALVEVDGAPPLRKRDVRRMHQGRAVA